MLVPVKRGPEDAQHLRELQRLVDRARAGGVDNLSAEELVELPRLYRFGASQLARLETLGIESGKQHNLRVVLSRAHGILHRDRPKPVSKFLLGIVRFLLEESPRALRAEWKLLLAAFVFMYGLAALSFFLVRNDLGLAYALFDPIQVNIEISQIQETPEGEPFKGNFTFGLEDSSGTAGWILAHNISVSVLFFGSGLVPPLFGYVLMSNALMLGTYTGVASHWGRAGEISSILWCHGVLEIQAIILAGAAGLVLFRAWVAPGAWSRAHAMRLEAAQAWRLMAPVFPMLIAAGLIEGFVSPHAPFEIRMLTAVGTGTLLLAWLMFGGRRSADAETA